jgi:hypothetical protein
MSSGAPEVKVENSLKCINAYREMYRFLDESPEMEFNEELKTILKKLIKQAVNTHVPAESTVLQNYPNPFNPETWIPYALSEQAYVVIKIYNIAGQLIRTLDLGVKAPGTYLSKDRAAYWDGKDDAGDEVASGVYFYRLYAGDKVLTRKMVVLK